MAKSLIAGNRRGILILSLLIGVSVITRSQDSCPHGSADEAANALEKALLSAKSCKAAAGKLWNCAWGSSADVGFAGIVIEKCQKTFLPKLSSAAEQSYRDQMEMCNYEYERQGGTMSRSFTSLCHVDLAAAFAANLPLASRPVARASFDCDKAQTVLERTICSDVRLGKADLVLSRVYAVMLKNDDKSDKNALIQNEIQWLQSISSRYELSANSPSLKSLNCTRILFEFRFAALDTCAQGGEKVTDCLKSQVDADYVLEDRADLEASLEEANRKAQEDPDPVHRAQLVKIRNEWQQFVAANCDLGEVGDTPTQLARACASDAIVVRILQLRACTNRLPKDQIPCLSDFRLFEKWPIVIYSKVK